MYYVQFKLQQPSPAPTTDFRIPVPENAKKKLITLT
jgi:hypothetical protein